MERGEIQKAVLELVRGRWPGAEVVRIEALAPDTGEGATGKAEGYGQPLRIRVRAEGQEHTLVLRTATPNDFGHNRRADRAEAMVLDYDTFNLIPRHVRALDIGAVGPGGRLISLREAEELFILTTYAPGTLYVDDLRAVAARREARALDVERCEALARYLVQLHREPLGPPAAYVRAVRDLVGHGEGIFGMVDGYPVDTPAAPPERLQRIERKCVDWRWKLRGRASRQRRTHGDFHPFNVVFEEGTRFTLVDASRGCQGDPADDVTAMAINYVFFAMEAPGAWAGGLGALWRRFWTVYLDESRDTGLVEVVAPFLAWRALVVCSPRFYPHLGAEARDTLLDWIEYVLDAPRFAPESAEGLCP